MTRHRHFKPSVHVSRPLSPSIRLPYEKLERLATDHNIEGLRFTEPWRMAATIINGREILELYKKCSTRLTKGEIPRLRELLKSSLPATASEHVNVPLTLVRQALPIRNQPVRHYVVAAPCPTAVQERAVLKEALADIMVKCVGSLAAEQVLSHEWQPQVHGAPLVVSHNEASVVAFHDVLQDRAKEIMPRSLVYRPTSVPHVFI